jgi:predicted ATPase
MAETTNASTDLQDRDQTLMFVAVDHLNNSPSKNHLLSAELNLEVGQLASSMAALAQAAAYFHVAFNELKKVREPWEEHYDLTLTLYQCRADVEMNLSRYRIGYDLSQEIFEHAKSLDDKLPVYVSMAAGLGRENKQVESLEFNKRAAQLLGKYPKRAILGHIVKEILAVKRYFFKTTLRRTNFATSVDDERARSFGHEIHVTGLFPVLHLSIEA